MLPLVVLLELEFSVLGEEIRVPLHGSLIRVCGGWLGIVMLRDVREGLRESWLGGERIVHGWLLDFSDVFNCVGWRTYCSMTGAFSAILLD